MNKKLTLTLGTVLAAGALLAGPHGGGHGGPRGGFGGGRAPAPMAHHRPAPPPRHAAPPPRHAAPRPMHHPHHHGGVWGRGGRNFWPGFVGGVVGGVVTDALIGPTVVAAPVVTTTVCPTPVYATQQVWVPGGYVDQMQPNGTVVRVWQPGHYEARQVLVQ